MEIPLVDLKRQYKSISYRVEKKIQEMSGNGFFILGEEVEKFEKEFADYCGTKYCIGVASGTDALLLILRALGIGRGDEVITVANTFIATVLPIIYVGAKPVFVEIDEKTNNIRPDLVKKAITDKTRAVIAVHLYGYPAKMDELRKTAKKEKLYLIEDACQAHGSLYHGKKCGSFGVASALSFYPGKNLGAFGDAGAVVTNNKSLAEEIRILRNVGQKKKYKHIRLGYNSRLDNIQAAVLRIKLENLDEWNKKRRKTAKIYHQKLQDYVKIPYEENGVLTNYHLYCVETNYRDKLFKYLGSNGIYCGMHYPIPIHKQRCMSKVNFGYVDLSLTERKSKHLLSLPIFPEIEDNEVEYICKHVISFYKKL